MIGGDVYRHERLILCEGLGDLRFLKALLNHYGMSDDFTVRFPDHKNDPTGGIDKVGRWIALRLTTSPSFREKVKLIVIMMDNDEHPKESFARISRSLEVADLPAPLLENELSSRAGCPSIIIRGIPFDSCGTVESLCLPAAFSAFPFATEVETFVNSMPSKNWPARKLAKARMQALLAATCEPAPDTSFAHHWRESEKYRIPLRHECFADVVSFLRNARNF